MKASTTTFIAAALAIGTLSACGSEERAEDSTTVTETTGPQDPASADETAAAGDTAGDAAAGEGVFAQCRACHSVEAGRNGLGPSLHGVVGRAAGSVDGFNYSPAMRDSGLTWTPEELDRYLEAPSQALPGTRMSFIGLRDAQQRANVIAYLETQR